jgi:hypothetical protein
MVYEAASSVKYSIQMVYLQNIDSAEVILAFPALSEFTKVKVLAFRGNFSMV